MEARMGGIFVGFFLGLVYQAALRLGPTPRSLSPLTTGLCWLCVGILGLDGLNAYLFDLGVLTPYAPRTEPRLLTGLAGGYALCLLAAPAASSVQAPAGTPPTTLGVPSFLGGLSLAALLGIILLSGAPVLLWPASFLMLASVVASFTYGTLHALRVARVLRGVAGRASTSSLPTIATGLAFLEIAALAALRYLLASHFGFLWAS